MCFRAGGFAPPSQERELHGKQKEQKGMLLNKTTRRDLLKTGAALAGAANVAIPGASAAVAAGSETYGSRTLNGTLLESKPIGVITFTVPVVAPAGTVVVISEFETTLKTVAVPLKLTLVVPVRSVPRILTAASTLPEVGSVSTNGLRPTDRPKTVP